MTSSPFAFDSPTAALAALYARLSPVSSEAVDLLAAQGRVLAADVTADRPSPACDVSAMDGYAVRGPAPGATLPVVGESAIGHAPPAVTQEAPWAVRIFTGGPVPQGAEAVIPREQLREADDHVVLPPDLAVSPGQHIRKQGENCRAGDLVAPAGAVVTPAVAAALSAFGCTRVPVFRPVRVAALITGNEVHGAADSVAPWQLRDSNGPALQTLLASRPWIDWRGAAPVPDRRERLAAALTDCLHRADAVILTGGVSMGDYDFVPAVVAESGCEIVFHKLPIRPGKPVLAAVGPAGQLVLGLPGNPVAVATTSHRLALPLLRRLAGFARPDIPPAMVTLTAPNRRALKLHWSCPVRLVGPGLAELVPWRGSGDLVAAARADGFVEIAPERNDTGPWPFYPWDVQDV